MKEVRDYLKLFRRYLPLTLGLVLLSVFLTLTWQWGREATYQTITNLYVTKVSEAKNSQYYTYEGYYSLLAAKEATDVLVGLLKSPDVQQVAYSHVTDVTGLVTQVKKTSQQLIEVRVTSASAEGSKKALTTLVETGTQTGKMTQENGYSVVLVNPELHAQKQEPNLALQLAIAVVGALLASFLVTVTREYFSA